MNLKPSSPLFPMYRFVRSGWHQFREVLERRIFKSRLQAWLWRYRHLYKRDYVDGYLHDHGHFHRQQVIAALGHFDAIQTILEIGCASGPNLIKIRAALPHVDLVGVDINPEAIAAAQAHFAQREDRRIQLYHSPAHKLNCLADQSVDIVLADAVLMFIAPDMMATVMQGLKRICRQGLILNEFHNPGAGEGQYNGARWVYDYNALLSRFWPNCHVDMKPSLHTGGLWGQYGKLITVWFAP